MMRARCLLSVIAPCFGFCPFFSALIRAGWVYCERKREDMEDENTPAVSVGQYGADGDVSVNA